MSDLTYPVLVLLFGTLVFGLGMKWADEERKGKTTKAPRRQRVAEDLATTDELNLEEATDEQPPRREYHS